jgi:hypothetical protein
MLGFAGRSLGGVRGCVGALDGLLIKVRRPRPQWHPKSVSPVVVIGTLAPKFLVHLLSCGRRFYCRKGFFAINLQAICDSRRRFLDASMRCPGSVNDSLAFGFSTMYKWLAEDGLANLTRNAAAELGLPNGFWIAGDNAYVCTDSLVVPFSGRGDAITKDEDNFNFYQVTLIIIFLCVLFAAV